MTLTYFPFSSFRQNSTSSSTFSLLPSTSGNSSSLSPTGEWCNQIPVICSKNQALTTTLVVTGCPLLKRISLQGCSSVTDKAVWCLLLHKPGLQVLRYHQAYSVAEILCRESVVFKSAIFDDSTKTTKEDEDDDEDYCPLQKRAKSLNYDSLPGVPNDNNVGKLKITKNSFLHMG